MRNWKLVIRLDRLVGYIYIIVIVWKGLILVWFCLISTAFV